MRNHERREPTLRERMLNQGGHFYVCGSARQVPEDIYTAMKEASWLQMLCFKADGACRLPRDKLEHEACLLPGSPGIDDARAVS